MVKKVVSLSTLLAGCLSPGLRPSRRAATRFRVKIDRRKLATWPLSGYEFLGKRISARMTLAAWKSLIHIHEPQERLCRQPRTHQQHKGELHLRDHQVHCERVLCRRASLRGSLLLSAV